LADANGKYKQLVETISSSADRAIPLTKNNPNPHHKLPFWNNEIKQALRNRIKCYNRWRRNNTLDNWTELKHQKATAQRIIRKAAKEHWEKWCGTLNESTKDGVVWRMAKRMTGNAVTYKSKTIKINNNVLVRPNEVADAFARHFASVSNNSNYKEPFASLKKFVELHFNPHFVKVSPMEELKKLNLSFQYYEMAAAINKAKAKSAPGGDRITYGLLKQLPRSAMFKLLDLYNYVWVTGQILDDWHVAIVLPLLKAGKGGNDPSSYRPISLTSCIGKILERMVVNRLMWHLEKIT
jgi:hypothetical protein